MTLYLSIFSTYDININYLYIQEQVWSKYVHSPYFRLSYLITYQHYMIPT